MLKSLDFFISVGDERVFVQVFFAQFTLTEAGICRSDVLVLSGTKLQGCTLLGPAVLLTYPLF